MSDAVASLGRFLPELILVAALAAVILADLLTVSRPAAASRKVLVAIALAGLVGAFVTSFAAPGDSSLFAGMVADDGLLAVFRPIFALASIGVLLFCLRSKELDGVRAGELVALLLTVTAALMWMAGSVNLVMIYLSLETVSVASYLMVGYLSSDRLSNEASLKYILFGAVSTGAMLFGLSLLYGMTGTLDLYAIRAALAGDAGGPALLLVLVLVAAGIGFKIAAVPFHFWCPDVYTGGPDPGNRAALGRAQGRRVRRAGAFFLHRTRRAGRRRCVQGGRRRGLADPRHRPLGRHDDAGERRGAAPDQPQAVCWRTRRSRTPGPS